MTAREPNTADRTFAGVMESAATSSLAGHVSHVVSMGAGGQMFWIDAAPHIARMHDVHPVRDWTVEHFIRRAMRGRSNKLCSRHNAVAKAG